MILIGSQAIKLHVPNWREPQDLDFVGTYEEIEERRKNTENVKAFYPINSGKSFFMQTKDGQITEMEVAWKDSRAEKLIKFVESQDDNIDLGFGYLVPSLDVLYLLKMSHRYLKDSPWTKKTMDDIIALRKLGAKIRPEHEEFLKEREKDTYIAKLPKLNQSKDNFFGADTGVVYKYDHDTIHEAIAIYDKPAYKNFQSGEVWCSKEMWNKCSYDIQLAAAVEEASVLALERSLVPFPGKKTPKEAFDFAYQKLMTSISSGWFREFVWENYYPAQELYEKIGYQFVDKFEAGIKNGVVKEHGEK